MNVQVTGEVLYEGDYALTEKSERLSDLIKKAGGAVSYTHLEFRMLPVFLTRQYPLGFAGA